MTLYLCISVKQKLSSNYKKHSIDSCKIYNQVRFQMMPPDSKFLSWLCFSLGWLFSQIGLRNSGHTQAQVYIFTDSNIKDALSLLFLKGAWGLTDSKRDKYYPKNNLKNVVGEMGSLIWQTKVTVLPHVAKDWWLYPHQWKEQSLCKRVW